MITARFLVLLLAVGTLVACGEKSGNTTKLAPGVLLAELQEAARNPGGRCRLDSNEPGTDKRVERLLRATAADIVSMGRAAYVVEPASELLIRAPEPQAPLLTVLVYLQGDHCARFHLADMWEEK